MKLAKLFNVEVLISVTKTVYKTENGHEIPGFGVSIYFNESPKRELFHEEETVVKLKLKYNGRIYIKVKKLDNETIKKVIAEKVLYLFIAEKEVLNDNDFEIEFF